MEHVNDNIDKQPLKAMSLPLMIGLFFGPVIFAIISTILVFLCIFGLAGVILYVIVLYAIMIFLLVFCIFKMEGMVAGINILCEGDNDNTMYYIAACLLSWITLGIFNVYYIWRMQKRLYNSSHKYNVHINESDCTLILILSIASYLTGFLSSCIAWCFLINNYNKMVYGYNNSQVFEPELTAPPRQGKLRCLKGELAGASIILTNDDIYIGRQVDKVNLVLSSSKISRIHCSISYDADADQFYITDFSKNGTSLLNGSALLKNVKTPIANNTEFVLTDSSKFIVTSGALIN